MALADLMNRAVTVRRKALVNVMGALEEGPPVDAAARASVQPADPRRTPQHLRDTGETAFVCYFASDPGVQTNDLILPPSGAALEVQAPAIDEAGRGVCFAVYCKLHS